MKTIKLLAVTFLLFSFLPAPSAEANCYNVLPTWNSYWCSAPPGYWGTMEYGMNAPPPDYVTQTCAYQNAGYSCSRYVNPPKTGFSVCSSMYQPWNGYQCTKNNYSATKSGDYTLIGKNTPQTVTPVSMQIIWEKPSPFIYLYNAPDGEVAIELDSQLDSYAPLPAFNQENGWKLDVKDKTLSIDGTKVDHVFYELALNQIALSRNGRNFASRADVIEYLENSDFLSRLGFSDIEQENSLNYLIPKLQEEGEAEYYYLTILDAKTIADTSTLRVTPEPDKIVRQYFAVYPSAVPVKTTGDFVFPEVEEVTGFTVKETGEFLINTSMFVFFK